MPDNRDILSGKRKYLYGLILLSFISVICVAFSITGSAEQHKCRLHPELIHC
jgi:hypothetical protein